MSTSARLSFVKLVVADLDASAAFWSKVLGQREVMRLQLGEGDQAFEEVVLGPVEGEGQSLLLLRYLVRPVPSPAGSVAGFSVTGIEQVVAIAEDAGGRVLSPPRQVAPGVVVAVIADADGHQVELVQQDAPGA